MEKPGDHEQRSALHRGKQAHAPQGCTGDREAGGQHQSRINSAPDQLPGGHHRHHHANPARHHQRAGRYHRIAIQRLQHRGQQRGGGDQQEAHQRDEHHAGERVAIGEQFAINDAARRGQRVHAKGPQAGDGDAEFGPHFPAFQPVQLLAAIKAQLQRRHAHGQQGKAGHVEASLLQLRFRQDGRRPGQAHDAERQVDQEHPAPIETVGEPAADHRAQDRPDHDANAPPGHGRAMFFGRPHIEQIGLAQRRDEGPGGALDHAEQHHLFQAAGNAAQHRSGGESRDTPQEQGAPADARRKPAGERRGNGGGDDIAGQHPGDAVGGGVQAGLHVRQRHVGDGGIEDGHEAAQHYHQRDGDRRRF